MRVMQIGPALSIQTLASTWSDAVCSVSSADDPIDFSGFDVVGPRIEFWVDRDLSTMRTLAGEISVGRLIEKLEKGWREKVPPIKRMPFS